MQNNINIKKDRLEKNLSFFAFQYLTYQGFEHIIPVYNQQGGAKNVW